MAIDRTDMDHATPPGADNATGGEPESPDPRDALHKAAAGTTVVLLIISALLAALESPLSSTSPERHAAAASPTDMVRVGLDPNTASWAEFALLPGFGEMLSRRCIAFREARTAAGLSPVFSRPEDLMQVRGIGRKTLERIRPHLRFNDYPAPQ